MKIAKHHHENECKLCGKTGVWCAMMEDLDPNYFVNVCKTCFDKGDQYCRKRYEKVKSK